MSSFTGTRDAAAFETTTVLEHEVDSALPAVSWQAVVAGGITAAAVSVLLIALGAGLGLSSVSPWPMAGAGLVAFGSATAIWLVVVQWVSAGFGGYVAGRLRTHWADTHSHEVFFRDTAHGFLSWAFATLIGTVALGSAAGSLAVGAAQVAGSGGMEMIRQAAPADPQAYVMDKLFRAQGTAPAASNDAAQRGEAARIFVGALQTGTLPEDDKAYLSQMIASRTGLSAADAGKRIDEAVTQAKAAEVKVREAADQARKAGAAFSFYLFFSLLVGAFIASVAAAIGGGQRDHAETMGRI